MILSYRFQRIHLRISQRGQRVYFNATSDKDYRLLKAVCLSVGNSEALYGSTVGIRIDEKEIFDESHEAHLLVYGADLEPDAQMQKLLPAVPVNSSKIEGIYTDSSLQGLLGKQGGSESGGFISRSEVNIKKTYVSGKDSTKYSAAVTDNPVQVAVPIAVGKPLVYPYDVRIIFLLSK